MERHTPGVLTYVVWHPSFERGATLARELFTYLDRNLDEPESRGLGIPVFFRSTPARPGGGLPAPIELHPDTLSFVVVLVDRHMAEDGEWKAYVRELLERLPRGHLLPCRFTRLAHEMGPELDRLHGIMRLPPEKETSEPERPIVHDVAHTLSRLLLDATGEPGHSPPPIRLFVSHAKRDGLDFAKALRDYIQSETQARSFFDFNDICPGQPFDVEIFKGIENSALVVIQTDAYASREWCRREVIEAKRRARPIVVVSALHSGEERSFPYLGNVPTLRWVEDPKDRHAMCRQIIDRTIREVLRVAYFKREVSRLGKLYPILDSALPFPRPPELLTLPGPASSGTAPASFVYPDPPIGDEEMDVLASFQGGQVLTPLLLPTAQYGAPPSMLKDKTIGISISDPEPQDLAARGLSQENVREATLECARYLLANGARLAYGGDLRPGGFTEQLITLVQRHNRAGGVPFERLNNYLAYYLHHDLKPDDDVRAATVRTLRVPAPKDLLTGDANPQPPFEPYQRARFLTAMRERMNQDIHARVVLGGQLEKYGGRWPGIVEEAYLAIHEGKPLFLLGGFGGAAGWLARVLLGESQEVPELPATRRQELTALGQTYAQHGRTGQDGTDLHEALAFFQKVKLEDLRNGLLPEENKVLVTTIYLPEMIALLMKGLTKLASHKNGGKAS